MDADWNPLLGSVADVRAFLSEGPAKAQQDDLRVRIGQLMPSARQRRGGRPTPRSAARGSLAGACTTVSLRLNTDQAARRPDCPIVDANTSIPATLDADFTSNQIVTLALKEMTQ